jgi:hypothetical protein
MRLGSARVSRAIASPPRTFGVRPKQSFVEMRNAGKSSPQRKVRDPKARSPAHGTRMLLGRLTIVQMIAEIFRQHELCAPTFVDVIDLIKGIANEK